VKVYDMQNMNEKYAMPKQKYAHIGLSTTQIMDKK
jgi:hypothetical protein